VQHAIGDHALLANRRTAALVDPAGSIAWLCWPRIDSDPMLLSIIEQHRGGRFSLTPAGHATIASRRYHESSLVLETVWRVDGGRLVVDDVLVGGDRPSLLRRVRAEGGDVDVDAWFEPAFGTATERASMHASGELLTASGAGVRVLLQGPGDWSVTAGAARCRFRAQAATPPAFVALGDADTSLSQDGASRMFEESLRTWRERLSRCHGVALAADAVSALGEDECRRQLAVSAAVLLGLQMDAGGIVAAPTTSLPQWPGSSRTWDYRYCWSRDASLAGMALVRLGLTDDARALGDFLGNVLAAGVPVTLRRVDGSRPPSETERPDLSGYRGARPVRFGNDAASQLQLDVAGSVIELACSLAAAGALPASLAAASSRLATWTVVHWNDADHGIWEIRGDPHRYTHSRVMQWAALRAAAAMAQRGLMRGDGETWRRTAADIHAAALPPDGAPLQLHDDGGGADAALSMAVSNGFLRPDDRRAAATLGLIVSRLVRSDLVERYEGSRDGIADRCAPFVFPTFWLAGGQRALGGDVSRVLRAAARTCGALGLYGEVVEPATLSPLGNYPQVQSHAACVLALTEPDRGLSSPS